MFFPSKITYFTLASMFPDQTEGIVEWGVLKSRREKKKDDCIDGGWRRCYIKSVQLSLVLVYRRLNLLSTNCLLVICI